MRSVGRDGTGPDRARLALDRRDRRRIGDAGRGQAVRLLELQHRRHRQRSVHAVLGQPRVGAERVERLLHPRRCRARHGWHGFHRHVGAGWRCRWPPPQPLHLPEHVVGLRPKLGLVPVDGSPVLAQVAQPDGRGLHRKTRALLAQLLEPQAGAGSAIVELAALRRDALAEDLAIAAAAVGLILVEQPRDLAAGAVRVPAHLEQPGLGAVGRGVAGGPVAAFAVAARRFAHAQADHQHEQVPQRIDPADVVAHAERSRTRRRSGRARRDWLSPLAALAISTAAGSPCASLRNATANITAMPLM